MSGQLLKGLAWLLLNTWQARWHVSLEAHSSIFWLLPGSRGISGLQTRGKASHLMSLDMSFLFFSSPGDWPAALKSGDGLKPMSVMQRCSVGRSTCIFLVPATFKMRAKQLECLKKTVSTKDLGDFQTFLKIIFELF